MCDKKIYPAFHDVVARKTNRRLIIQFHNANLACCIYNNDAKKITFLIYSLLLFHGASGLR